MASTQLKDYLGRNVNPKVEGGGGGSSVERDKLRGLFAEGTLATDAMIESAESIHVSKNTLFATTIIGTIDSNGVEIGVGRGGVDFNDGSATGKSLKLTSTSIILGSNTYAHELTLGEITYVSITVVANSVLAKIDVVNDYGDLYTRSIDWRNPSGKPFVKNYGANTLDVKFAYYLKDINKKIWIFGDSYCGYTNYERWPYYVVQDNYDNFLLNAKGGYDANESILDLKALMEITDTTPSVILWALGMNHAGDSNGNVNADWMAATNELIGICEANDIELVFTTIPSLPNIAQHTKTALNNWIKNSGYRYVDVAHAMGDDAPNGNCRGWGTDKALLNHKANGDPDVHPTQRGAKVIYRQVLSDFPEIAIGL